MTADDVRARFEASYLNGRGIKEPSDRARHWLFRRSGDGYADHSTDSEWEGYRAAHADLSGEVRELVEALELAKRAYWLARNSAAGLTNYCEESASSRRCERELSEAESLWHSAGIEAALAKLHPTRRAGGRSE